MAEDKKQKVDMNLFCEVVVRRKKSLQSGEITITPTPPLREVKLVELPKKQQDK